MLFSGYNFGIQALLGALAGPAAVGVFHACRLVVQPVVTLIAAVDSLDKPRFAGALADAGRVALNRAIINSLKVLICLGLPYLILAGTFSDTILQIGFADRYSDQSTIILAWCLVVGIMLFMQPIESALYVTKSMRPLFVGRTIAAIIGIAFTYVLVPAWGTLGALSGMACAYAVAAATGALALRYYRSKV